MKAKKIKKLVLSLFAGMAGAAIVMLIPACSYKELPKNKIVRVMGDQGMCSGEQVKAASGVSYIMTAGHCRGLADKNDMFTIITEDHKTLKRKFITEDPNSDLMLIEGLPGVEGLELAHQEYPGQVVITLTHGSNLDTYMTKGVLIQSDRIVAETYPIVSEEDKAKCTSMPKNSIQNDGFGDACCIDIMEVISTAKIVPGSSGGAVLNKNMDLIGVASAGRGDFSAFVSLKDIKAFLNSY